jgi:putative MATE family efflux protein
VQLAQPVDMAQGKVPIVLGKLALPLMASLFFQNLYAYADTVFVAWLGESQLAAVSMSVPLTYVALSLAKGISMGSVVLMSFARGRGDTAGVRRIASAMLPLMTLCMVLFLPLGLPQVCRAFYQGIGANAGIANEGMGFVFWLVCGFPVMGYVFATEAVFMARGDTVTPMKAMLLGNALNIALDPLYIFVFDWGAAGAAGATFTGQCVAAIYLGNHLKRVNEAKLAWLPKAGCFRAWRQILGQGMFVALAYLVSPAALLMLNSILVGFGPVAVGAWNLMSRTEMMVMLPVMGLSNALANFTGFNLGRRDYERVRQGLRFFLQVSWGIIAPVMLVFIFWPQEIIALFRPAPELRILAGIAIQASGVSGFFVPLISAVNGLSQGLRRPLYMVGLSFVYLICLRIPLANEFAARWGEKGVFWSHPTASACAALLAGILLWQLLKQCKQSTAALAITAEKASQP